VHAELRLGLGVRCGRKRVARLMRQARIRGIGHRRNRGRRRPAPATHDDLVRRRFVAAAPDRLWCTDSTEHPTGGGTVYLACVEDVFSRQIVGWSIADHMRSELVVDALQMATWRRPPAAGTVVHRPGGPNTPSGCSGTGSAPPGLLGSMGRVASSVDNCLIESFFSTLQRELLDTRRWTSRAELGSAIFEWIEAWYNPRRRHTALGNLSPVDYEHQLQARQALHTTAEPAA